MLAAVAAAVLVTTGGSSSLYSLADVASRTAQVPGAHLALQTTVSGAESLSMTGSGTVNFRREESAINVRLEGIPQSATAELGGEAPEITERETGGSVYVHSPLAGHELPDGATWIKVDVASLRGALGADPTSAGETGIDPDEYLRYLQAHGAHFSQAGTQTIRGVSTRHYVGTFDLLSAIEASAHGALTQTVTGALSKTLTNASAVPVQVWVDKSGLLRREQVSLTLNAGQPATATTTLELFDFGPTPHVTPPPSNETYDATGALQSKIASVTG